MAKYSGKTVLITGASSGIGEALARRYASLGANLVLVARRIGKLEELAKELTQDDQKAIAVEADVGRDGEIERACKKGVELFGRIDVSVVNAGFGVAGRLERLTLDDYRRQFEVNVFGALRTVYASVDELKKTQGRIVLIGSMMGFISAPECTPYCMSKFAITGLSGGLNAELSKYSVSVTLISPGSVDTGIFDVSNKNEHAKSRGKNRPPKWLMMPVDKAARQIERAATSRKRHRLITLHAKIAVFLNRLFPWLFPAILKFSERRQ